MNSGRGSTISRDDHHDTTCDTRRPAPPTPDPPRNLPRTHRLLPEEVRTLLADIDDPGLHEMITERHLVVGRHVGKIIGLVGWKGNRLRLVTSTPPTPASVAHSETDFRHRTGASRLRAGVALHAEPFYRAIGYELIARRRAWDGCAYLETSKPVDAARLTAQDPTT